MSFKAQLEILIHLESFRNINIYHQGIYVLRCQIYQKLTSSNIISSHPYNIVQIDEYKIRKNMMQKYKIPAGLYDNFFYSKAFLIKYMDEIVDLDDICHFRAEIDAFPVYNEDNFFLLIDLLYCDTSHMTSESNGLLVFY